MSKTIYMVYLPKYKEMLKSGRNYTPFTTTSLGSAKAQATRHDGVVMVVDQLVEWKKGDIIDE